MCQNRRPSWKLIIRELLIAKREKQGNKLPDDRDGADGSCPRPWPCCQSSPCLSPGRLPSEATARSSPFPVRKRSSARLKVRRSSSYAHSRATSSRTAQWWDG